MNSGQNNGFTNFNQTYSKSMPDTDQEHIVSQNSVIMFNNGQSYSVYKPNPALYVPSGNIYDCATQAYYGNTKRVNADNCKSGINVSYMASNPSIVYNENIVYQHSRESYQTPNSNGFKPLKVDNVKDNGLQLLPTDSVNASISSNAHQYVTNSIQGDSEGYSKVLESSEFEKSITSLVEQQRNIMKKTTHNLIERKRRDVINECIYELHHLIPPLPHEIKRNKGSILRATVEYVKNSIKAEQRLNSLETSFAGTHTENTNLKLALKDLELFIYSKGLNKELNKFLNEMKRNQY